MATRATRQSNTPDNWRVRTAGSRIAWRAVKPWSMRSTRSSSRVRPIGSRFLRANHPRSKRTIERCSRRSHELGYQPDLQRRRPHRSRDHAALESVLQTGLVSDLLSSMNYLGPFVVFHKQSVLDVGGLRHGVPGAEVYDLALRVTECSRHVHHVPDVLVTAMRTPTPRWRSTATSSLRSRWSTAQGQAQSAFAYLIGLAASRGNVYSAFETPSRTTPSWPTRPRSTSTPTTSRASSIAIPPSRTASTSWSRSPSGTRSPGRARSSPTAEDHPGYLPLAGCSLAPGNANYSNANSWYNLVNARTAIGISQDGRTLYLFTVDVRPPRA